MIEIPLVDKAFAHTESGYLAVTKRKSLKGNWKREFDFKKETKIVVTHTNLKIIFQLQELDIKVYAWLIEPGSISPESYDFIKSHYNLFHKIFTWDKSLLEISDKFILIKHGTTWIEEEDCKIYKKTKNLSFILTKKQVTAGHRLRSEIYNNFNQCFDVYGKDYNYIPYKLDGLKDYRYQVVVENVKQDYGFTEKIMDCFLTGVVPIYWGCPSIGEIFNINGIIQFDNLSDLKKIISELDKSCYEQMMPYIEENFNIAKKYTLVEDQIFDYIKNDNN